MVDTWTELRDALSGTPGGSQTTARTNTVPRIIYVKGLLNAFTASNGTTLTCDSFANQVTVPGTAKAFTINDHIAYYDPKGPWGEAAPSGPLEDARVKAATLQAAQTQQHVGLNVTIVGAGADTGITGANLRIRDAHNVIVRSLTISDAWDCFPDGIRRTDRPATGTPVRQPLGADLVQRMDRPQHGQRRRPPH